jgi:hypothetical protein
VNNSGGMFAIGGEIEKRFFIEAIFLVFFFVNSGAEMKMKGEGLGLGLGSW